VTPDDAPAGRVRIHNKYYFTSLDAFAADWNLEENGKSIAGGKLAGVNAKPGEEQVVAIPWGEPKWQPGSEYFLTVKFHLRTNTLWAEAGQVVAWDQIPIPAPPSQPAATISGKVDLSKEGMDWMASANGTTVRVDGQHGWLKSFSVAGRELLAGELRPNFWRVPTDNDLGWKVPDKMGAWKDAVSKTELQSLDAVKTEEGARIIAAFKLPVASTNANLTYLLRGDGTLRVELQLELVKDSPELPRIGVQFAIPAAYDAIRWFGRGPQETYCDRKTGAAVGLYQSHIEGWITPYVRPQENANRTDVRWIDFANADGIGLRAQSGNPLLGVSAWPYSADDLAAVTHNYQLPRRDFITVSLDGWQMGVGGDTSWGLPVHKEYRILAKGKYEFSFDLRPLP
jgi:beta-galactosidase